MGPGICFPLLSTQGNLDTDGSQITGKEFVPEPPGECGWTSENGKKASALSCGNGRQSPQHQLEKATTATAPTC